METTGHGGPALMLPNLLFQVLVILALMVTCCSPVILVALLIADWKKGRLW